MHDGRLKRIVRDLGFSAHRNIYWSWYEPRNFGDWVTPFLFEAITGEIPRWCARSAQRRVPCIYGAGSLLRHIPVAGKVTVWGSGIISESDEFAAPRQVTAVRGPRTAHYLRRLGYATSDVFGDPAILLPTFYQSDTAPVSGRCGFIPHYMDLEFWKDKLPEDVFLIDVTKPVDKVIDDICSCERTISSSLHGIIVSQAYGRRSAWMTSVNKLAGDQTKFFDYYEAGNVRDAHPFNVQPGFSLRDVRQMIDDAPQAEVAALTEDLLKQCPFTPKRNLMSRSDAAS
ncbi:polysaccharide pyruvyl transferase family protein [uncultured Paracoccus sp.]|uniref:polysaccharide pyruvyl transferase family protein n=1 Tax=uncultured Paracoccus sp. TaxID=189685 RepID=UPI0025E41878|nr:polysaccharide pyruvyl transferase family protein [uncultured Paracoccus sp.]